MRVVVCGSRTWTDRKLIRDRLADLPSGTEVITGAARGADTLADNYAREHGLNRVIFPANWTGDGRAAGPMRNRRMLDMGPDLVIAFRADGESRGTDDMIEECRKRGIPVEVVTRPGCTEGPA